MKKYSEQIDTFSLDYIIQNVRLEEFNLSAMTQDNFYDYLEIFRRLFFMPSDDLIEFQKKLYGESVDEIEKYTSKFMTIALSLEKYLDDNTPPEQKLEEEYITNNRIIRSFHKSNFHARELLLNWKHLEKIRNPELYPSIPILTSDVYYKHLMENIKLNDVQKFILKILDVCYSKGYKKIDKYVYKPIYTRDMYFTHTFELYKEISAFIYDVVPFDTRNEMFEALTSKSSMITEVTKHLTACVDYRFPFVKKNRFLFSFSNGIYDIENLIFTPYQDVYLDPEVATVKYFDQYFDYNEYKNFADPFLVPTPFTDVIFKYQKFNDDVLRWVYIMSGRLLYPVGLKDNWQVMMIFKGLGGTGKSTFLTKVLKNMYASEDIGLFNNKGRQSFSLEAVFGKLIFLAIDIDDKFTLDETLWNSIVSGEDVSIDRLFHVSVNTVWTIGGVISSNSYLPFKNRGGSASRRQLIFEFNERIRENDGDTQLSQKIQSEMPALIYKFSCLYRQKVDESKSNDIWRIVPEYFKKTKADYQANSNPISSFLTESKVVELDRNSQCTFDEFRTLFNQFCTDWGIINNVPKTMNDFKTVFAQENIILRDKKTLVGIKIIDS